MRRHDRRVRAVLPLVLLIAAVSACEEEEPRPEPSQLSACGQLARVSAQFGGSLGGPYLDATLSDFRFAEVDSSFEERFLGAPPRRFAVLPPSDDACAQDIAARLEGACGFCRSTSFEGCLLEVEAAFRAPSAACSVCGDGRCTGSETPASCATDCACGDGYCDARLGELPTTCPEDCPVACGNGVCEALGGEACGCPEGVPGCRECARDCCVVVCGDGTCDAAGGESLETCEQDCGAGFCGDGLCLGSESPTSCPGDCPYLNCAICPGCHAATFGQQPVICGDGVCTGCEPWTCQLDCWGGQLAFCTRDAQGQRVCPERYCGDGTCEGVEDYLICPQDCPHPVGQVDPCSDGFCSRIDHVVLASRGTCADLAACGGVFCGDGYCQAGERRQVGSWPVEGDAVCPQDCGSEGCLGVDRASLCADGLATRRCESVTARTAQGALLQFSAMIDCALACPIVRACDQLCIEDAAGEPACTSCPGQRDFSLPACRPGDPPRCMRNDGIYRCEPSDPSVSAEHRPECHLYVRAEFCPDGCSEETDTCEP